MIERFYRLTHVLAVLAALAGMLMAAFVCVGVAMRYVMGEPLAVQEEVVGLLFCSMVFLALPRCTHDGSHVCATLVRDRMGPRGQAIADFCATLAIVVFGLELAWISYDFAYLSYRLGARSTVGNFLLYPWMGLIPLMSVLTAVTAVLRYFRRPPAVAAPAL